MGGDTLYILMFIPGRVGVDMPVEHAGSLTVHPGHGREGWSSAVFQVTLMFLVEKKTS